MGQRHRKLIEKEKVRKGRTKMDKKIIKTENERKKEELWKYRKHGGRIKRIEAEIEEIKEMKRNPSFKFDGMPKGNNESDLSDYIANLDEMEEELYQEGIEQIKEYNNIKAKINELEDENEKDVLFYRYIKKLDWWDIADKMGYSERWITEIHGRALKHFKI